MSVVSSRNWPSWTSTLHYFLLTREIESPGDFALPSSVLSPAAHRQALGFVMHNAQAGPHNSLSLTETLLSLQPILSPIEDGPDDSWCRINGGTGTDQF